VVTLKRVRIMNVTLKGLKVGQWRHLSDAEMAVINDSIADSGKTQEHSLYDDAEQRNYTEQAKNSHAKPAHKRDFQGGKPRRENNDEQQKQAKKDSRNTPYQKRSTTYVGKSNTHKANTATGNKTRSSGTLSLKK